ncbi:type IV pilus assembly protein PilX [Undibacterium sp. GrIS 1.8]|uniref:pilus assembly PilX family protein n=1 Tax=unclassified Undibacterium TaxID=2630295 RepID=UPI00339B63E1
MKKIPNFLWRQTAQRGSVLIMSIILILLLTVIGLGMISLNGTQTKIAANSADALIAFQTAEGVLNQAQTLVSSGIYTVNNFSETSPSNTGLYVVQPGNAPLWTTIDWTTNSAVASFQGSAKTPGAYIIELLPPFFSKGNNKRKILAFRITARAVGPSGNTPVMLQSVVQVQE